jgi:cytochrome c2
MRTLSLAIAAPVLASTLALTAAPARAQDGAALYNSQCKSCHTLTPANSPAGPSLKGVVGRKLGGSPGYLYSKALVAKGGTWTEASLDAYLAAPQAFAPGGRMAVAVAAPGDRAAVIAYLKTLK